MPGASILNGAAFSPDGSRLAYAPHDAAVALADLSRSDTLILEPEFELPDDSEPMRLTRLIWSPNGTAVITVFSSAYPGSPGPGKVILWGQDAGGKWHELHRESNEQASYDYGHMTFAAFNPSGTKVALYAIRMMDASTAYTTLYDLQKRALLKTYQGVAPAAWMDDSTVLLHEVAYNMRLLRVDLVTGEQIFGGAAQPHLPFSPDGGYYLQIKNPPRRGISVVNWRGKPVAEGTHEYLNDMGSSWSPNGHWIASFGSENTINVWEVIKE
jgi:WD40 repeat protein